MPAEYHNENLMITNLKHYNIHLMPTWKNNGINGIDHADHATPLRVGVFVNWNRLNLH